MLVNIDEEFEAKLGPDMWDWESGILKLEETPYYFHLYKNDLTGHWFEPAYGVCYDYGMN